MFKYLFTKRSGLRFLCFVFLAVLILGQYCQIASALSPDQLKIFQEGINYYDTATCDTAGAAPASPTPDATPINATGPVKQKAYPGDTIKTGDTYKGKASVYGNDPKINFVDHGDNNIPALQGASNDNPGIAVWNSGTLGGWWKVQAPNGKVGIIQQTDLGPSTSRTVDINAVAARSVFGYKAPDFPTDQGDWTIQYMGNSQPTGAITKDSGGVGDASANPTSVQPPSGSCSCSGNGSDITVSNGDAKANEKSAFDYFVSQGLSPQQSAGIVGNLMLESAGTMDPGVVEGGGHSDTPVSTGWGIAQWTPGTKITDIASSLHITTPLNQLQTQLAIIWGDLNHNYSTVLHDIKSASTIEDATKAFEGDTQYGGHYSGYEDPQSEQATVGERTTYAKQALRDFGGDVPGAAGVGASCPGAASTPSGYQNPLRDWNNLVDNRVDQGVDYSGVGPVYAIGNGTIDYASSSTSWPGGNYISYKLSDGPAAGKEVYVAEDCNVESGISHGKSVTPNTVLCKTTTAGGYIYIETGWSAPTIDNAIDTTLQPGCYDIKNSKSTAFGMNFRDLMVSLGVKSGNEVDKPIACSLPSGWPTW